MRLYTLYLAAVLIKDDSTGILHVLVVLSCGPVLVTTLKKVSDYSCCYLHTTLLYFLLPKLSYKLTKYLFFVTIYYKGGWCTVP